MRTMSVARRLAGDSLIYGLGSLVPALLGLLTVPFVARALDSSDYGRLELVTTTVSLAVVVLDCGLSSAMARFFLDLPPEDVAGRRSIVSSASFVTLGSSMIVALLAIALAGPAAPHIGEDGRLLIVLAALSLPLTILTQVTRETMRLQFRPWRYLTAVVLAGVPTAVLAVLSVTVLDLGVIGILAATAVGLSIAGGYGIVQARTLLSGRASRTALRRMLAFGLPLVPGTLALWGMAYADRVILGSVAGTDAVGVYAIANRVTMPLALLSTAIGIAYLPFMFELARDSPDRERSVRRRMGPAVLVAGLTLSVILAGFAPEIIRVLAPAFRDAADSVGVLAIGLSLYSLTSVLVGTFLVLNRTALTAVFTVMSGIANVALCLVLIPPFGPLGAALATAGGYLLLAGLYVWFGIRNETGAHDLQRLIGGFVLALVVILGILVVLRVTDGLVGFGLRVACVAVFFGLLPVFRIVTPGQLRQLLTSVRQK